ncbi:MAG TPA: hypothetical protein VKZ43_02390 [Trueperaceae bacterium]|nr:hypothetical protein [Trueperaceae bacterium]
MRSIRATATHFSGTRPRASGFRLAMLTAVVTLVAAACVPTTMPGADTGVVAELERTANILFHRMELGYLDSGIYTTNVLIDAQLPEGARWTLQDFATDGSNYVLVLTSSNLPETAWRISPRGVSRTAAPG